VKEGLAGRGDISCRTRTAGGGYAGSTYDLRYEAATDRLIGTYYQAVAKQTFDVFFIRKP